jgi:hypothetical protein
MLQLHAAVEIVIILIVLDKNLPVSIDSVACDLQFREMMSSSVLRSCAEHALLLSRNRIVRL